MLTKTEFSTCLAPTMTAMYNTDSWWKAWDANDYATVTTASSPDDPDIITLDELNYVCKLGKKDKKLAAVLHKLLAHIEVELPF